MSYPAPTIRSTNQYAAITYDTRDLEWEVLFLKTSLSVLSVSVKPGPSTQDAEVTVQ
jgi:hypothetical protein